MKIITFLSLLVASPQTIAFTTPSHSLRMRSLGISSSHLFSSAPSDVASDSDAFPVQSIDSPERDELKRKMLLLCASYDRGFGASKKAKNQVDELIQQLEMVNPTALDASRGVDGSENSTPDEGPPPLEGTWRMVWTTALDVLNLAVLPVATPGAIYQVIEPPIATNIIDFIPRAQNLLPSTFPTSLIRAEVKTRASIRPDNSNRVGLNFEAVKLVPVEVLGMKADFLPPLSLNLPGSLIKIEDLPGVDPATAPGYFDVVYLDNDMLIIRQNAPGGYFVSVKVDDCDP